MSYNDLNLICDMQFCDSKRTQSVQQSGESSNGNKRSESITNIMVFDNNEYQIIVLQQRAKKSDTSRFDLLLC